MFIGYDGQDYESAVRLYNDLKRVGLNPWLDKKDLLPGQSWNLQIRKATKKSKYFTALFYSISIQKRGYVQKEFKHALDVFDEFPPGKIFAVPTRLDDFEIPYERFNEIERVDLFPDCDIGVQRLLRAIGIEI